MFNPRVSTTLHNKKIPNILATFEVFNVHSKFGNKFSSILGRNVFEKISANILNFCWAVAKISRVYGPKNSLGIKKKKKKEEKDGKIIECIAIGLRHLSVRRPK